MEIKDTLQKIANYIAVTQPLLDKADENRTLYIKRAHQVAGVLANRGIIAHDVINEFVDKIAADETGNEAWNIIEKLAEALPANDLGKQAEIAASGTKLDAFEKLALYGDARADVRSPGVID